MENKQSLKKKSAKSFEESSWIIYFVLSSWLVITVFFFSGIYKSLLLSIDKKYQEEINSDSKVLNMLIDQGKKDEKKDDDTPRYLSDQTIDASGKITKKKGFENYSESRDFKLKGTKTREDSKTTESNNEKKSSKEDFKLLENSFTAKIVHLVKKVKQVFMPVPVENEETTLPQSYDFKKEFVFSWDETGKPVIPTIYQKHFEYYKKMVDKIQSNWAPPGGNPFPIFDGSTASSFYIPGRSTYQTFPEQDIRVLFSLDKEGNVLESKINGSIGFESLDRSCLDAIRKSKNFGSPPEELLNEKKLLIIPFVFRIIGFNPSQ